MGAGFALTEAHIRAIRLGHALVFRGVLGPDAAAEVHEACAQARAMLKPAKVGHGEASRVDPGIRSDLVGFTHPHAVPPGMRRLVAWFRALERTLDRDANVPIAEFHLQVACYPGNGTCYKRHIDAMDNDTRTVTAIYYPNVGYPEDGGGELRMYLPDGIMDVAPEADVAVVFLADCVPHEVLPARAERFAVTAWYR